MPTAIGPWVSGGLSVAEVGAESVWTLAEHKADPVFEFPLDVHDPKF